MDCFKDAHKSVSTIQQFYHHKVFSCPFFVTKIHTVPHALNIVLHFTIETNSRNLTQFTQLKHSPHFAFFTRPVHTYSHQSQVEFTQV